MTNRHEAEGQDGDARVVRRQTLGDGAHAHAVHAQDGEHLELGHALVVGASGHRQHALMHSRADTNLELYLFFVTCSIAL